jgi:hypothetical protein
LFFKLVALTESNLNHPDDLWRTGVVLNHFSDGTKALIKVENSTLSIHTKGQYKVEFLQLLSHYIQATLLETKLIYNSFERVLIEEETDKKEAEYDLIDSKLLDSILNNTNLLETLTKHNREKSMIINNYGNVGNQQNNSKSHNIKMINTIEECLPKLEHYQTENPKNDIGELIKILNTLPKQQEDKSLYKQAIDGINKYIGFYKDLKPIVGPVLVALSGYFN